MQFDLILHFVCSAFNADIEVNNNAISTDKGAAHVGDAMVSCL